MWGLTLKSIKMLQLCHKTELVSVVVTVVSHCTFALEVNDFCSGEMNKCSFSFACHMSDAHVFWDYMEQWTP